MEEKIDLDQLEQEKAKQYFAITKEMFPDVDYGFLESKCIEFAFDLGGFNLFILETMLPHAYPRQRVAPKNQYEHNNNWKNFTIVDFLHKFPDPREFFSTTEAGLKYVEHSVLYLEDRYVTIIIVSMHFP